MDGNGRWADQRGLPRVLGHREGVKRTREVIETAEELGVKHLTLYAFSEENWKRPKEEVEFLLELFRSRLEEEIGELKRRNVRLRVIGNISALPPTLREVIRNSADATASNTGLQLTVALSYSGREEILEACRLLAREAKEGRIQPEANDAPLFGSRLTTAGIPDPDLVIRTSGEFRVSNFLLWQICYSEFYFTETLWPDFTREHFEKALEAYDKRERRFGLRETAR